MTSFIAYPERTRDIQDGFERHSFVEQTYVPNAGSIVKVKGTGSEDQEAPVLNIGGVSFNLPKDTDTEVFLLSGGSDTNMKFAIMTIPRDKQRNWKENTGGVQDPTDPDKAVEFNSKRTHVTKGDFATGTEGILEVKGDTVYIRGKLVVQETATVNQIVITPVVIPGQQPIPNFEP